ncbi:MAG: PepSY domain-containing protein [Micromonosporaceae bacterium]
MTRAVAGKVSSQQAPQTARHLVPGAKVTETERDREHGRAVWEVELHKQHHEWEVTIDAATGKVLSIHHDTGMEDED